jgi:hypothetical protein
MFDKGVLMPEEYLLERFQAWVKNQIEGNEN